MTSLRRRWQQVKARFHRQHPMSHHRHVVPVPWDEDAEDYLAALPCVCGQASCGLQTIGLVVPQRLTSEAWQQQAQAYYAQRRGHEEA
jgi:hypothetical protein